MPYQANRDATIPKVIGTTRNAEGERVAHYESVTYPEGAVVFEQDIAPHVLRRLEEGDDRLSSLLRYIDDAEARQIMGQQIQDAASQPGDEVEILHQEELEGNPPPSPAVGPEHGSQNPPYEGPPTGKGGSGAETAEEVVTEDQTIGQGTEPTEEVTTDKEASESDSETVEDASEEEEPSTTEEVEQQTDTEAAESSSDEDQQDGQGQSDEVQEKSDDESESGEVVEDQFTGLDKKSLLEKAKEAKVPKRTKMDEDELRAALREKAE